MKGFKRLLAYHLAGALLWTLGILGLLLVLCQGSGSAGR